MMKNSSPSDMFCVSASRMSGDLGYTFLPMVVCPLPLLACTACAMVGEVGARVFQEFLGQGQGIAEPAVLDRDREVSQLSGIKTSNAFGRLGFGTKPRAV